MARTDLIANVITAGGIDEAALLAAANVDGHAVLNDGRTFIVVNNGSAGSINVTIQANRTVDGLTLPDRVVAVAVGERMMIVLGSRDTFNQRGGADDGKVYVDFSAVTTITVAAFRL